MTALDLTRNRADALVFGTPQSLIMAVAACPRLIIQAAFRSAPGGYVAVVHNDDREQFISVGR